MSTVFPCATRALAADSFRCSTWGLCLVALLLGAWGAWACLAHITVYAVTDTARLEVDGAVYPIAAPVDGRIRATRMVLGQEVQVGDVLIELEADVQRLQREEEQTRLTALARQAEALRDEIAATEQALAEARQAGRVALDEARAQFQEALAVAQFAVEATTRLTRLHARGLLAEVDLLRAQAEAQRRQAAAESHRLAVSRLQREQQTQESDRKVHLERLKRDVTLLAGQQTTATATIARLTHELERRRIRVPVAGRVGEVAALQIGTFVQEGARLGAVVPAGNLRVVADFLPEIALGRLHTGQSARVRLASFPWAQYGSIAATVASVASEVRDGRVRAELTILPAPASPLPIQHSLPGTVEVEVEQVTPATLVRRAAGQLLAAPTAVRASRGGN